MKYHRAPSAVAVCALLLGSMLICNGYSDWDPADGVHKMHHPQLPDLTLLGMDVDATGPIILADDFKCSEDGLITRIHIWGSWLGDEIDTNAVFVLSIHSDIPTNELPGSYSRPGETLWFKTYSPSDYRCRIYASQIQEGWYAPPTDQYIPPPADTICYQYNFEVDPEDAFTQTSGTIYWLDVQYVLPTNEPPPRFGWKTAMPDLRWNDDATWVLGDEPTLPDALWKDMTYPGSHPLETESFDLAFVIDGDPASDMDFGDAIDPSYPTYLANDGARHVIVPGFFMGQMVEADPDGQPSVPADGDDVADGTDDEDGVVFSPPLIQGQQTTVAVQASQAGQLDAWMDFNADGDWADAGEQIFAGKALSAGLNNLQFSVPAQATPTNTYARFRFSSQGGLSYTGSATNGEVEDYVVAIQPSEPEIADWGDANVSFPTMAAANGARHTVVPGVFLGASVDAEADGQPDGTATGDDKAGIPDDEDGVAFPAYLLKGQTQTVQVIASVAGYLTAWIDYDGNGAWNSGSERVFAAQPLAPGINNLSVAVVPAAASGGLQCRFRFTTNNVILTPTGSEDNGEVEDYEVLVVDSDYGDAPAPYPTTFGLTGAVHAIRGAVHIGVNGPDHETDGLPDPNALGDDNSGIPDDEDGVAAMSLLAPGNKAYFDIVASQPALLSAWIDYTADGDWADANERICADAAVTGGVNRLEFRVPRDAVSGSTFARLRISSAGGLSCTGPAPDGEVEDHLVTIQPAITITNMSVNGSTGITVRSVGYYGGGTQLLQAAGSLLPTNWVDLATNPSPLAPPQTNVWTITPRCVSNEYYRVLQK